MHDDPERDARRRTAAEYDALPYPSFPYGYLHPGRLAALAVLHGLAPAPVEGSQVLELGCAGGGNLIPLAAQFPQARFVGIDLSPRQVEDGRQRIARLGLDNIELLAGDVAEVDFGARRFDTILCHGVYSWVPEGVRAAILRLCARCLAPDGLAAVSYNVLPGWHLRSVVRDICLAHAGTGTPAERATRARAGLLATAAACRDAGPYGALLRSEAQRVAESPAAYIAGEFLAEDNTAFHFEEFAAHAAAAGLGHLCEGSLSTSQPETFVPAAAARIRELAGGDPIAVQRHTDLLSGRRFRRSILVRAARLAGPREVDPRRLRTLHFSSTVTEDVQAARDGARTFVDGRGRRFTLKDAAAAAAFAELASRFPSTASFEELAHLGGAALPGDGDPVPRLERALMRLLGTGRATVSTTPLEAGRADAAKPRVWALARDEAATGQPWVTGRHHVGVPPPPAVRLLMPHLDGSRDAAWMQAHLQSALDQGLLTAAGATAAGPTPASAADPDASGLLRASLHFLDHHALLDRA